MKLLLLAVCLYFSFTAQCQLDKGVWLVGGSGSFYSYNEDYSTPIYSQKAKYTKVDITASVGYFLADKVSVGLKPYFSSYKGNVTSLGGGSTSSYQLAIGPFARYYFLNIDRPFNIVADVGYQMGLNKYLGVLHEKGKFNTFSAMAGTEIFFNDTAGLEILVGYTKKTVSIDKSASAFNNTKKGLFVSVGFNLHLEKN